MKISVIGCGRWGTFLAWYLNKNGHEVALLGRKSSEKFKRLKSERRNDVVELNESILLSNDFEKETLKAELIVISIASQQLRSLAKRLAGFEGIKEKTIVLCMKGLEKETGKRLSEIIREEIGTDKVAVWVGPGHVQEFVREIPNCMVIDSENTSVRDSLIKALSGGLIRFYVGCDMIGNEIGAASKNVVGIAAGMLDGLKMSCLKGALMSRGTNEIGRLIEAMGGNRNSVYGLAHLGDYQATVFSQFSHNRTYGEKFVTHSDYKDLAEGVDTTKALKLLGEKYNVELPIVESVYQVLFEGKDALTTVKSLFLRDIKKEM